MRARLLLLAAALAAFGASLGSGFHFDDYAIFSDPNLQAARGWLEVWSMRQTRPLTYLTFWFNLQLNGQEPWGFHAVNLVLHLAAVLLAYECLRRLLPGRAAIIAATLFAIHPIQAEAVDYVWARSILLATVLCCASLLAWMTGRHWVAVVLFGAALLAKEECAAFPLALAVLQPAKDSKRQILAMLLVSFAAGARVIYATAVTPGAPAGLQAGISPWHYFVAQGTVIWRYLRLVVIPWGFTVDPQIGTLPVWVGLLAWVAIAVLVWRVRSPWLFAGVLLLLPSSSIFPAADLAADRRMYLPMLAFSGFAGLLLARFKPRAIAAGAIAALLLVSISRTYVWSSDERLWREAVRRAPEKVRPKIQLARDVAPGEAMALLNDARNLAPNDPEIATETGKLLLAEGHPAEALSEFGRALALDPRNPRNYNNRGVALAALGQTDAARADFRKALEIDPGFTEPALNLERVR